MPIDDIRGTDLTEQAATYRLGHVALVSPSSLVREHKELSMVSLTQVQINQRLNIPVYTIKQDAQWLVFNAETAEKLAPLSKTEASIVASNHSHLPIRAITWVDAVEPGSEYRSGELPAWKVELEGSDNPNLWIGANTGQLRAVRTQTWRIYDFLWSLHIMDYQGRDNFNSWLLRGFALLGVFTVVSGIVLFIISKRRRRRRQLSSAG